MASTPQAERINNKIAKVQGPLAKTVLGICSKNKLYPKDCIVDGSLEGLIDYILELEKKVHGDNPVK